MKNSSKNNYSEKNRNQYKKSPDSKINSKNTNSSKKNNILLLPGSRSSEIKYLIPEFIKLIKNTNNKFRKIK